MFMLIPQKRREIRPSASVLTQKICHHFAIFIYFPIVHNLTYFTDNDIFQKKYLVKKCIQASPFKNRNVVLQETHTKKRMQRETIQGTLSQHNCEDFLINFLG